MDDREVEDLLKKDRLPEEYSMPDGAHPPMITSCRKRKKKKRSDDLDKLLAKQFQASTRYHQIMMLNQVNQTLYELKLKKFDLEDAIDDTLEEKGEGKRVERTRKRLRMCQTDIQDQEEFLKQLKKEMP